MRTRILLICEHGSHLYNLARPDSDIDLYEIYTFPWKNYRPKKLASQSISQESDKTTVSLDRYIDFIRKGIPQAIETLFATKEHWVQYDSDWEDIRSGLFPEVRQQLPQILSTYKRTALNFHKEDNIKKNRHALRLIDNASHLKDNGYFNPSLTHPAVVEITALAKLPWNERLENFKSLFFKVFGDIE